MSTCVAFNKDILILKDDLQLSDDCVNCIVATRSEFKETRNVSADSKEIVRCLLALASNLCS